MKKNYILFLLFTPFIALCQTTSEVIKFTSSITPDLSMYGEETNYPGEGEYQIFYDTKNNDQVLDKPVIVVDGFDTASRLPISEMYKLLTYTNNSKTVNLADELRSEGYDIILLDFPKYTRKADGKEIIGGNDFIERSAMLLVDLINTVNTQKTGTIKNVIIGPSSGGIISKYALNYMENKKLNHDVALWLSIDAPHLGMNIPIGFQHQFNYLAFGLEDNSVTELQPLVANTFKSPLSRQLLVDQFETHLKSGEIAEFDPSKLNPQAHPWRAIFENKIKALTPTGYPSAVRKACVVNGSATGKPYTDKTNTPITPGFVVMDEVFDVEEAEAPTKVTSKIQFTPQTASASQLISKLKVVATVIVPVTVVDANANSKSYSYTDGVDAASGGLVDINELTKDIELTGIAADFFKALKAEKYSFVPTVSSLAINFKDNQTNWYHKINLPTLTNTADQTPFNSWHLADENEIHTSLNVNNVAFIKKELADATILSVKEYNTLEFKIQNNPVVNELVLLTQKTHPNANLVITDMTGKTVFNKTMTIENRTSIPLTLKSGLYLLNIKGNKGNFNFKFVVK